jgi:phosphoenolpyruvate carboxykinase (GTP)
VERLEGKAEAVDTPIGRLPAPDSLDVSGLNLSKAQLDLLLTVDREVWAEEAALIPPHYAVFGRHLPQELTLEHEALVRRLKDWTGVNAERPAHPAIEAPAPHPESA